jgi:hypothetical protein
MVDVVHFQYGRIRGEQLARFFERHPVEALIRRRLFRIPFEAHRVIVSY